MAIISTSVWMLFVSILVSQTTPVFANISLFILILLINTNKNYYFCIYYSCLYQNTINGECFLWLLGFFMYSRIIYLVIGKAHLSYNGAKCNNYIPLFSKKLDWCTMQWWIHWPLCMQLCFGFSDQKYPTRHYNLFVLPITGLDNDHCLAPKQLTPSKHLIHVKASHSYPNNQSSGQQSKTPGFTVLNLWHFSINFGWIQ